LDDTQWIEKDIVFDFMIFEVGSRGGFCYCSIACEEERVAVVLEDNRLLFQYGFERDVGVFFHHGCKFEWIVVR